MKYIYPTLMLLTMLPLTGCHDDDSSPVAQISNKTYTDSSGLELYYNGNKMPGKTVTFSQDGDKATVTAYSTFELSQLSGFGLSGKLPSPGIIPGSPRTIISTEVENTGEYWEFTGTGENDYCTFSYSGYASPEKLKLYISDAKLKSRGVNPPVWKPAPIEKNSDGTYKSLPIYSKWEYDPIPEVNINFSPVLSLISVAPVIPVYNGTAYMSVSEALHEILQAVAFLPDGNILFTYISEVGGAAHLAQNEPNGYQYVIAAPGLIKTYINPLSFFSFLLQTTSGSTPAKDVDLTMNGLFPSASASSSADLTGDTTLTELLSSPLVQKILKSVLPQFLPLVSEGIPLAYSVSETPTPSLKVFIDTEIAVKIMTAVLTPILEDNATIEAIKGYIAADPTLSPLLPDIEKALQLLTQALERTTSFNLGLNLVPYE